MTQSNNHLLILAGGTNNCLYAAGASGMPVQFTDPLGYGKTLLQLTFERFIPIIPIENIWVIAAEQQQSIVAAQLPQLPASHILLEPCQRGTAPSVLYASWRIKSEFPHANIVVSPSDHLIAHPEEFTRVILSALDYVNQTDAILTIGIKPKNPETSFGYIQADLSVPTTSNKEIFRVDAFCEKPNKNEAMRYVERTNCFWNAGIFVWNVNTIINAFRVYQPELSDLFETLLPAYNSSQEAELIKSHFQLCDNISIDRAILENADEIFVFPADFGWSDIGCWNTIRNTLITDSSGNSTTGCTAEFHNANRCIVHANQLKRVVVNDLDGYLISENNGELLICKIPDEAKLPNR